MSRLVALCLTILVTAPTWAENWPQWRGPKNDGVSTAKNISASWGDTSNIVWKTPMPGRAGSTPCIWGDRIFLSSTVDGSPDLIAVCIRTDGNELWRRTIGKGTVQARADEGDGASASPSTDGKHVWFFVGTGDLACLDFNGNEVWKTNCQTKWGRFRIQFGMHSTPVLHDGKLYLMFLHDGGQHVI